ncbi:MAG: B12-binding domain-containing radical SAM protein [Dehalococcoidia bacterium]|nr:B12-binding domain-containing radical SAM protein [Dehalococcoidia bacterium]
MKVLLVYPRIPETFWSFKHALRFASRKTAFPPLGLLTVAAMLPPEWEKKLVDMNATRLRDDDLRWADYVFISAMVVQQESAKEVAGRCKAFGTRVVAGGPMYRDGYAELGFEDVDHMIVGEAENVLPQFLLDLENGCAAHVYSSDERPDIESSPVPLWSLLNSRNYEMMSLQYSRGCPYNCEFCDIVIMNGHVPRTKTREQVLAELDALYAHSWRGNVFFTDDNFIGNKHKLKTDILPALVEWSHARRHPFSFFTEASVNLADDEELMRLMVDAGFNMVFVGIESPNEESLVECNKMTNTSRDLIESVKTIQRHGMQVQGGFIVGFDGDPPSIFRSQIDFIQKSGIVTAMVGVLMAPPGTPLYKRLEAEGRLQPGGTGNNTDGSTNIVPKMGLEKLTAGYKQVVSTIYSPRYYYERVRTFMAEYQPSRTLRGNYSPRYIRALFRCMWTVGVKRRGRTDFWKGFAWTVFNKPRCFPMFISLAVQGYHYQMVAAHAGPE